MTEFEGYWHVGGYFLGSLADRPAAIVVESDVSEDVDSQCEGEEYEEEGESDGVVSDETVIALGDC